MPVDVGHNVACELFKVAESLPLDPLLVNDDALSPTLGIMHSVYIAWAVETTSVMKVQNHVHLVIQDDGLNLFYGVEFRVCATNGGELSVEVPVNPPRTFDDANEV